jgi:peptide deformylase
MELTYFPDPVIVNATERVETFDAELEKVARQMFLMMYENKGVGLAANQAGINKRIAVINPTGGPEDELILVNPEIIASDGSEVSEEGCLSCPGINAEIKRADAITLRFQDVQGAFHTLEAQDMLARIIQHEVDHLDGRVIIDRMSPAARILNKRQIEVLRKKARKGK